MPPVSRLSNQTARSAHPLMGFHGRVGGGIIRPTFPSKLLPFSSPPSPSPSASPNASQSLVRAIRQLARPTLIWDPRPHELRPRKSQLSLDTSTFLATTTIIIIRITKCQPVSRPSNQTACMAHPLMGFHGRVGGGIIRPTFPSKLLLFSPPPPSSSFASPNASQQVSRRTPDSSHGPPLRE